MRWKITCLLACLVACFAGSPSSETVRAQEKPPVRLRLTALSVRNRSSAPIAVQIKLEYNQPTMLVGDLELSLYDALDIGSEEDLLATMKVKDLTLVNSDYIFNTIIPPLQTSTLQNLAVQAWFRPTTGDPIPLSSSLKEINPPRPHDVLTISPMERATVLCSCRASTTSGDSSENREFLERSLSLENYNPEMRSTESGAEAGAGSPAAAMALQNAASRSRSADMGRHIQYYSVDWSTKELPPNPLFLCSFDVVLFAEGGLSQLSEEQIAGLMSWVRGGGSVCFVADTPLKSIHLGLLQQLFEKKDSAHRLALDDDGRLTFLDGEQPQMIQSHVGLGRAVLLRADADWSAELTPEELGQLNGFLWKVRSNNAIQRGEKWAKKPFSELVKEMVPLLEGPNAAGVYTYRGTSHFYTPDGHWIQPNQELTQELLESMFSRRYDSMLQMLAPISQQLVTSATVDLMPDDVEMVPAWIIALILLAYIITIGPVDYLVLGLLKMRKYTWVAFPAVTAVFTGFTILVAHEYMGSTDTGGFVEITDLGDDGMPVRQTRLEMLFYGSRTTHKSQHAREMLVASKEMMSAADYFNNPGMMVNQRGRGGRLSSGDAVVNYSGRFPDNYQASQVVQQWSPQLIRSLKFAPEVSDLPELDWTDTSLVSTPEGRLRLQSMIAKMGSNGKPAHAVVLNAEERYYHSSDPTNNFWMKSRNYASMTREIYDMSNMAWFQETLPFALIDATSGSTAKGFFSVVSQVSPQGSGHLEDLPFVDPTDVEQWALIVVIPDGSSYRVYRKSYRLKTSAAGGETNE